MVLHLLCIFIDILFCHYLLRQKVLFQFVRGRSTPQKFKKPLLCKTVKTLPIYSQGVQKNELMRFQGPNSLKQAPKIQKMAYLCSRTSSVWGCARLKYVSFCTQSEQISHGICLQWLILVDLSDFIYSVPFSKRNSKNKLCTALSEDYNSKILNQPNIHGSFLQKKFRIVTNG